MKLAKTYEPQKYEENIYALWEEKGAFKADPTRKAERFSISMPPPNETGTLSLGHAMYTLQDIMARHARMQGKDVLWLPGTDHAALAVNALIEKQLAEEGTDKYTIGREEFIHRTKEFVAGSRGTMVAQMRAMGFSADWSRQRYTLDEALNRCVNETFMKMYDRGLIYRGHRIVNWDPNLQTTVSDDEVIRQEEKAKFYTFRYGPFQISTARPETKFGDKYVVMHPDDKRYKQYKHGDKFEAEWINGPVTATVIKDKAVDPAFGTGVMTITPWHDHTDFEIAERHGLEKEQVIDYDGKLLPIAEEFAGMHIADARDKIVAKLDSKGLLVAVDEGYVHSIAVNERGKGIIEPQIKLQWFIDVNRPAVEWKGQLRTLKEVMRAVIDDKDITLVPGRFNKTYFNWIDNLRDWCISRQIWWGHRIPVWYREVDGQTETKVSAASPEGEGWEQDPDTLDTWFSAALWTWSTLIDPELAKDQSISLEELFEQSIDFQAYHPTNVLETGWDIIFFWVARMILSTTFMTGQVPFKTVYLHGMVRAADGKKMSKSRPESIVNPLDVIKEFGTDALRMGLITSTAPGQDQNWSRGRIEASRNFCNKLWNIARFVQEQNDGQPIGVAKPETTADHWLLSKLQRITEVVDSGIENYRFSDTFDQLYHFIWDDFADWYVEVSKSAPNIGLLQYGLDSILALCHPFAPFVTEAIWQELGWHQELLASSRFPKPNKADSKLAAQFEELRSIITETRAVAAAMELKKPTILFDSSLVAANKETIVRLARLGTVKQTEKGRGFKLTTTKESVWLDVDDTKLVTYKDDLSAKLAELSGQVRRLEQRLSNKNYLDSAPQTIVQQTRDQLSDVQTQAAQLQKELARLG